MPKMIVRLFEELPVEAKNVLLQIKSGGTFAHKKDGSIYRNRESKLPVRSLDYYREYTVPTPEMATRGSRRLVIGNAEEIYYTDDHYLTFQKIIEEYD
jgi:ribonuclease T1